MAVVSRGGCEDWGLMESLWSSASVSVPSVASWHPPVREPPSPALCSQALHPGLGVLLGQLFPGHPRPPPPQTPASPGDEVAD